MDEPRPATSFSKKQKKKEGFLSISSDHDIRKFNLKFSKHIKNSNVYPSKFPCPWQKPRYLLRIQSNTTQKKKRWKRTKERRNRERRITRRRWNRRLGEIWGLRLLFIHILCWGGCNGVCPYFAVSTGSTVCRDPPLTGCRESVIQRGNRGGAGIEVCLELCSQGETTRGDISDVAQDEAMGPRRFCRIVSVQTVLRGKWKDQNLGP